MIKCGILTGEGNRWIDASFNCKSFFFKVAILYMHGDSMPCTVVRIARFLSGSHSHWNSVEFRVDDTNIRALMRIQSWHQRWQGITLNNPLNPWAVTYVNTLVLVTIFPMTHLPIVICPWHILVSWNYRFKNFPQNFLRSFNAFWLKVRPPIYVDK